MHDKSCQSFVSMVKERLMGFFAVYNELRIKIWEFKLLLVFIKQTLQFSGDRSWWMSLKEKRASSSLWKQTAGTKTASFWSSKSAQKVTFNRIFLFTPTMSERERIKRPRISIWANSTPDNKVIKLKFHYSEEVYWKISHSLDASARHKRV
jgi:hypothetical protein